MARFLDKSLTVITAPLGFPNVSAATVQLFRCKDGELAGFQIVELPQSDGTTLKVSAVYDYTTGAAVLLGTVSIVAGTDLAGGMFSSGCWCSGDPTDSASTFYLVDYP